MKRFLAKLALALAVAAVPCFPLRALQSSMREQSVSEVVKASDAAVVLIETADSSGGPLSQGSGFIDRFLGRLRDAISKYDGISAP